MKLYPVKQTNICKHSHANLVQLAYDEGSVVEWSDLFEALPVDDGHGLEAHGLH